MPVVSEALIEETWRRVGAFDGRRIMKLQKEHLKVQPQLTMFVYSSSQDFRPDAAAVLIYVYHVMLEAFLRASPLPKRVTKGEAELACRPGVPDASFALERSLEASPEPYVLRYAYEAFTEADDVVLTEHELESFIAIVQTAIDCLHRACESS